ncbi:MAG: hypothetical protein JNN04_13625 [Cyclobacteriaceae bacterium]|nr:hypothetical protein [Cyclobacteriaceae bacterium]
MMSICSKERNPWITRLALIFVWLVAGPALAQPVMIRFVIGSELATTMTQVTDEHIDTEVGPYYFKDVERLTFQMTLPDSATVEKLKAKGIEIYLRSKRITPVRKAEPPPPAPVPAKSTVDTVRATPAEKPRDASKVRPQTTTREYSAETSVGLGLGIDHGGFGMKLTLGATSMVSVFGGLGYNLHKIGYNAGLEFNFTPKERTSGFLSAMYGYNAVLIQPNNSYKPSETFYGPSFGFGVKSRARSSENYFSFQIIYPIRDSDFMNAPKAEKPWPVLISLGYQFGNQ